MPAGVLCFDRQADEKMRLLRQAIKRQTDILVQVYMIYLSRYGTCARCDFHLYTRKVSLT